jgi:hypothetical protein
MNDFFAGWYELLAYFDGFSDDMYNQDSLYVTIGLCMTLIPIGGLTVYYYAINSVRVSGWWRWLLLVAVLCGINFCIAYSASYNDLVYLYEQQNKVLPYGSEFVSLALMNALWTFAVSFVWSMIIKWGSRNLRRTPF